MSPRVTLCEVGGHFRSGFGPFAGSIYTIDRASLLTQDFAKLRIATRGAAVGRNQIRISNIEIRNKSEIQMFQTQVRGRRVA